MRQLGALVVIDGPEAVDHNQQITLLSEQLARHGYDVEIFNFPQMTEPSSIFIKHYTSGYYGSRDEINPYTGSLLYAIDRFHATPRIKDALNSGKVVLCNRYTGANMAHMGAKIDNEAQRRGFFMWLDSMEFQMLGVPRPEVNFILQVPRNMHTKKDVASASLVYDDLCKLFPKDYVAIDCARGGEVLPSEQISHMLWERTALILPNRSSNVQQHVGRISYPTKLPDNEKTVEHELSELALSRLLIASRGNVFIEVSPLEHIPSYYTPPRLDSDMKNVYRRKLERMLVLHVELKNGLISYMRKEIKSDFNKIKILSVANNVLPLATLREVDGASNFTNEIPATYEVTTEESAAEFALKKQVNGYSFDVKPLTLLRVVPRNEFDVLSETVYPMTNISSDEIGSILQSAKYDVKAEAFQTLLRDSRTRKILLTSATYQWEIVDSYLKLRNLLMQPHLSAIMQPLTPRYGYEMPEVIENAGLTEKFEECFDLSTELYSKLQAAGYEAESQYAVLQGHKQRVGITSNAYQLLSEKNEVMQLMNDKLREVHPTIFSELD